MPPEPVGVDLAAFPLMLAPIDLRSDRMTVTGAENEFRMELDFEAVYWGGPYSVDLYIAVQALTAVYPLLRVHSYRVPDNTHACRGRAEHPWEGSGGVAGHGLDCSDPGADLYWPVDPGTGAFSTGSAALSGRWARTCAPGSNSLRSPATTRSSARPAMPPSVSTI